MSRPDTNYERARVAVDALLESQAVTRLESGFGRVCTYGPGERVLGIKFAGDVVTVRVCIAYGTSIVEADAAIRSALVDHVGTRRLDIEIADMDGEMEKA